MKEKQKIFEFVKNDNRRVSVSDLVKSIKYICLSIVSIPIDCIRVSWYYLLDLAFYGLAFLICIYVESLAVLISLSLAVIVVKNIVDEIIDSSNYNPNDCLEIDSFASIFFSKAAEHYEMFLNSLSKKQESDLITNLEIDKDVENVSSTFEQSENNDEVNTIEYKVVPQKRTTYYRSLKRVREDRES